MADKFDKEKLRLDLIEPIVLEELAKVLTFGAKKYGANNWKGLEDFNNRYYAALLRHIIAWRMGEDRDKESGLLHLSHAITNLHFLIYNNNDGDSNMEGEQSIQMHFRDGKDGWDYVDGVDSYLHGRNGGVDSSIK